VSREERGSRLDEPWIYSKPIHWHCCGYLFKKTGEVTTCTTTYSTPHTWNSQTFPPSRSNCAKWCFLKLFFGTETLLTLTLRMSVPQPSVINPTVGMCPSPTLFETPCLSKRPSVRLFKLDPPSMHPPSFATIARCTLILNGKVMLLWLSQFATTASYGLWGHPAWSLLLSDSQMHQLQWQPHT